MADTIFGLPCNFKTTPMQCNRSLILDLWVWPFDFRSISKSTCCIVKMITYGKQSQICLTISSSLHMTRGCFSFWPFNWHVAWKQYFTKVGDHVAILSSDMVHFMHKFCEAGDLDFDLLVSKYNAGYACYWKPKGALLHCSEDRVLSSLS